VFVYETKIRMQHTDAAGIVFFARFFELAHVAYEEFLTACGQPLPSDLAQAPLFFPIVHASSDYRASLRLGDAVRIEVEVREVKSRSFTLGYRVLGADATEAALLTTVHMAVAAATGRSTRLPEGLAAALRA